MLRDEDSLLNLVGAIHAAAADPDPMAWRDALARIGDAFGGVGVMVVDHRMPDTFIEIADAHLPPQIGGYIVANYGARDSNPVASAVPRLPLGVPLHTEMLMGRDEYERQGLYQDVLRPLGYRDFLFALLRRDSARFISMSLTRPMSFGPLGGAEELLLARLLPHIASAAFLHGRVAHLLAAAEAPRRALDLLDRAVILVDAAGRIAYANPAAARLLARRDGLAVDRAGALVGARPEETGRLRQLIAAAAASGAGRGLNGGSALPLPRPSGRPYVVQVLPLAPDADLGGVPHLAVRPAAALVVSDPDARPTPSARLLQQAYDLTPAEAELAARLVAGASLPQAATALGVGINTAKTQLKAIFAKLEVDRQAALVQRILSEVGGGP